MSAIEDTTLPESTVDEHPLGEAIDPPPAVGRQRIRSTWYGILALAILTAYFAFSGSQYLYTYNLCLLAVIGAVSLDLLKGTAGMVSTGNAAFMAAGAFGAIYLQHVGLPFPLDIIGGGLVAGVAGFVIGSPALRLRGMQLFLATMAGHFIIIHFAFSYEHSSKASAGTGFFISPLFNSKGIDGGQKYWAGTLCLLVALVILGASRLVRERSGRAWRMIRDHEVVAHTLGIRVTRYKMLAFVMSSVVIGFQGGLMAHFTGSVSAEGFTFELAISFIIMVIVGGLDSIAGAIIGAFTITALPVLLPKWIGVLMGAEQASAKGPAMTTITYGLLVVVFVTCSPNGMIGLVRGARHRAVQELRSRRAPKQIA